MSNPELAMLIYIVFGIASGMFIVYMAVCFYEGWQLAKLKRSSDVWNKYTGDEQQQIIEAVKKVGKK